MSDTTPDFLQTRPYVLDAGHLKRSGVLSVQKMAHWIDIGAKIQITYSYPTLEIHVPRFDPNLCEQFDIEDNRFWRIWEVKVVYREINFGKRLFFVCPYTGEDCLKLYLHNGMISTRPSRSAGIASPNMSHAALVENDARRKLLKLDGRKRLSSDDRSRLERALRKHPERYRDDKSIARYLERLERKRLREEAKFHWESRALSTTKALDNGRGINQYPIFDEVSSLRRQDFERLAAPLLRPHAFRGDASQNPELDIKVLIDRNTLCTEGMIGRSLGWPEEATGSRSIYMFVKPGADLLPYLVFVRDDHAGNRHWQIVDLLPSSNSGKPRYFLCPISRARCETLYL